MELDGQIVLLLLLGGGIVFAIVHWRYHPASTPVESLPALQRRLRRGRPVVVQFHAPL